MRRPRFSFLIRNLFELFAFDIQRHRQQLADLEQQISILNNEIDNLKLVQSIMSYSIMNKSFASDFCKELDYLATNGITPFPYENLKTVGVIEGGKENGLPYVIHNGKKLFFPQEMDLCSAKDTYRNYIENENLLGGGYKRLAPHQYQTDDFHVDEGDVVIDLGCAEALFALDVIDKASKIYLVESDPKWLDALHATFDKYGEKCTIVNKLVADIDSPDTVSLKTILSNDGNKPVFIKMDIEGYEYETLSGSCEFLRNRNNIKIACCTYHKANDADRISALFDSLGYNYGFSEGVMLFYYDRENLIAPYFRKGIIRAQK